MVVTTIQVMLHQTTIKVVATVSHGRMSVAGGSTKIDVKNQEMSETLTIGVHIVQDGTMDSSTVGKGKLNSTTKNKD